MLFGVCTFNFVFYIVRLLPGSELPDRAAAAQTAQVYALWVGDASGTQVACKLHARCASDEFKAILKLFFAILRHFKFQLCFFFCSPPAAEKCHFPLLQRKQTLYRDVGR